MKNENLIELLPMKEALKLTQELDEMLKTKVVRFTFVYANRKHIRHAVGTRNFDYGVGTPNGMGTPNNNPKFWDMEAKEWRSWRTLNILSIDEVLTEEQIDNLMQD